MDAVHLIGAIIEPLKPDLAEIAADESGQFAGALADGLLDRFRRVFEEKQVDVFGRLIPLPNPDDLSIAHDSGERVIDELAFPAGERLVGVFGPQETVDD